MSKFEYTALRIFKLQFNIGIIKSKLFIENNLQGHRGCQKAGQMMLKVAISKGQKSIDLKYRL